jgi:hypothetical protein
MKILKGNLENQMPLDTRFPFCEMSCIFSSVILNRNVGIHRVSREFFDKKNYVDIYIWYCVWRIRLIEVNTPWLCLVKGTYFQSSPILPYTWLVGVKGIHYQLTDSQSASTPMTTLVGHYVHKMGCVFHLIFYPILTNILL